MTTKLLIAGHGRRRNGTFDGGAYGYMTMGEHVYMRDHLFPAMKKFLPDNTDVVFHTAYNVYSYGNLVSLANSYGSDTEVYEFHFDALTMGSSASGGHVIIYNGFVPDTTDLALRDVIKKMVGVRYSHKGYKGVSGRSNLANVNRAANGGINYRLLELGFGTNRTDSNVMLNQTEEYAKALVKAIFGSSSNGKPAKNDKPVKESNPPKVNDQSIEKLAQQVIQGNFGSGQDRKNALGSKYDEVQAKVNEILTGTSSTNSEPDRSIAQVARDVINGKYGNGEERKKSLGSTYQEVQEYINKMYYGKKQKSVKELAEEVIAGKHGDGEERKKSLGSKYQEVQEYINKIYS